MKGAICIDNGRETLTMAVSRTMCHIYLSLYGGAGEDNCHSFRPSGKWNILDCNKGRREGEKGMRTCKVSNSNKVHYTSLSPLDNMESTTISYVVLVQGFITLKYAATIHQI